MRRASTAEGESERCAINLPNCRLSPTTKFPAKIEGGQNCHVQLLFCRLYLSLSCGGKNEKFLNSILARDDIHWYHNKLTTMEDYWIRFLCATLFSCYFDVIKFICISSHGQKAKNKGVMSEKNPIKHNANCRGKRGDKVDERAVMRWHELSINELPLSLIFCFQFFLKRNIYFDLYIILQQGDNFTVTTFFGECCVCTQLRHFLVDLLLLPVSDGEARGASDSCLFLAGAGLRRRLSAPVRPSPRQVPRSLRPSSRRLRSLPRQPSSHPLCLSEHLFGLSVLTVIFFLLFFFSFLFFLQGEWTWSGST